MVAGLAGPSCSTSVDGMDVTVGASGSSEASDLDALTDCWSEGVDSGIVLMEVEDSECDEGCLVFVTAPNVSLTQQGGCAEGRRARPARAKMKYCYDSIYRNYSPLAHEGPL